VELEATVEQVQRWLEPDDSDEESLEDILPTRLWTTLRVTTEILVQTARERFVSDTSSASRNVNNRGKTRAPNERFCTSEPLSSGCSLSGTEVRIPFAPPTSPRFEAFSGENQYRNASAGLGQFEDLPLPAAG
jgi:hypothetical protein